MPGLLLVLLLSTGVSVVAWRLRTLSLSGGITAAIIGTSILLGSGWWCSAILLTFFIGSSAVSRAPDPATLLLDTKGSRRDSWQVLANGGMAAIIALGTAAGLLSAEIATWGITTSLAVAAADTWASGIGLRSTRFPRDLLSGKRVEPGTGGAVSWLGTAAAVLGSLSVATVGAVAVRDPHLLIAGVVIGVTGMAIDSVLGSRWQARYKCSTCSLPADRLRHRCGSKTVLIGGTPLLNNDGVNGVATVVGGLTGLICARLMLS
jgi:uncharacterized protein (TIGR00297 family)